MRKVKWTSKDGYYHCRMIRDNDPDEVVEMGIPCDPPDINQIDWEAVKRDLNNLLAERELILMADINKPHGSEFLRSAAQDVLYKRLLALYQTPLKEESNV